MPFQRVSLPAFFAIALLGFLSPALAQDYDRPPSGFGEDQGGNDGGGYDRGYDRGGPDRGAAAEDAGGVAVRVGKLESRIREMTGQIEELQNANRKLVEQLQKFQQDVDSRLTSGGGRTRHSEATPPSASASEAPGSTASAEGPSGKAGRKGRGNDAFDPDSAPSNAAGRPKPLGSTASAEDGGTPMDLSGGKLRRGDSNSDTLAPTLRLPSTTTKPSGGTTTSNGTVVANNAPSSPRAEFDLALGHYKDKQYEDAEKGFSAFIQKNPKSRLAADATYYLGESFQQRGRSREAAEQYLKVSTDFSGSSRAPDAMLHLGMSLKALGAKEQACATFSEIGRKYPNAPAYVKSGAEREAKRAQC